MLWKKRVFPSLLGLPELQNLDMRIHPKEKTVYVHTVEDVMMAAEAQASNIDAATGLDESLSEEEILLMKLDQLRERMGHDLTEEQKDQVTALFLKYKECWLKPAAGKFKLSEGSFVPCGNPVKMKLRRLTPEQEAEMDRQLDSMLKAGVIRPSRSPWGSVPLFVPKKDGSPPRIAYDYRGVNRRLVKDAYPLPLIQEGLQKAARKRFLTCLDGMWGFWNVRLNEESKAVTAIVTHRGLFEFNVLPFGICNSPGEFQRAMDLLFGSLFNKGVSVYIDDITIATDTFEEHLECLGEVLKRCCKNGLYLKVTKSHLGCKEVPMLGHVVGRGGIMPDPKKVAVIRDARPPMNRKELQSFLGFAGYLRKFVPFYSDVALPLTELNKPNVRWEWRDVHDQAFQALKNAICEQTLLNVLGDGLFVLLCDASDYAIGSALAQWRDEELFFIAYGSKKFGKHEVNWSVREKEAFAIRWSLEHFRDYVRGHKILVLTDHANLQWMDKATEGKIIRWVLYMQQFDIEIRTLKGDDNVVADWLSRCCMHGEDDAEADKYCQPTVWTAAVKENEPSRVRLPLMWEYQAPLYSL